VLTAGHHWRAGFEFRPVFDLDHQRSAVVGSRPKVMRNAPPAAFIRGMNGGWHGCVRQAFPHVVEADSHVAETRSMSAAWI
jgi:hypothetical protein